MAQKNYEMQFTLNARTGSGLQAAFQKTQAEMSSLQKAIKAYQSTQKDIGAYQKQQAAVTQTEKKLDALKQKYENNERRL